MKKKKKRSDWRAIGRDRGSGFGAKNGVPIRIEFVKLQFVFECTYIPRYEFNLIFHIFVLGWVQQQTLTSETLFVFIFIPPENLYTVVLLRKKEGCRLGWSAVAGKGSVQNGLLWNYKASLKLSPPSKIVSITSKSDYSVAPLLMFVFYFFFFFFHFPI